LLAAVVEHIRRAIDLLHHLLAASHSTVTFGLINCYYRIRISRYYFHALVVSETTFLTFFVNHLHVQLLLELNLVAVSAGIDPTADFASAFNLITRLDRLLRLYCLDVHHSDVTDFVLFF
jgi:hypothetical protein